MKWTNPKINHTAEGYLNVSDIKRIVGNIEYCYYGFSVGASMPTPTHVAPMVETLLAVTNASIIYKDHFDWIRDAILEVASYYNSMGVNKINLAIDSTSTAANINNMETVCRRIKINLFTGWGL